jgi:hypothetical protein
MDTKIYQVESSSYDWLTEMLHIRSAASEQQKELNKAKDILKLFISTIESNNNVFHVVNLAKEFIKETK